MLLPEGVRIGEPVMCPSLGSPDGVAPDSEARHVSSGEGVPTHMVVVGCGQTCMLLERSQQYSFRAAFSTLPR